MPAKDRVSPAELAAWPARPPPDQSGLVLRFIPGVVFALTLLTGTAHNLDFVQRYPETRACCNMGIETETYVVLGVRIAGSELRILPSSRSRRRPTLNLPRCGSVETA